MLTKPTQKIRFYDVGPLAVNLDRLCSGKPGPGVDLNEDAAKKFLKKGATWFAPTDVWNTKDSADWEWN